MKNIFDSYEFKCFLGFFKWEKDALGNDILFVKGKRYGTVSRISTRSGKRNVLYKTYLFYEPFSVGMCFKSKKSAKKQVEKIVIVQLLLRLLTENDKECNYSVLRIKKPVKQLPESSTITGNLFENDK